MSYRFLEELKRAVKTAEAALEEAETRALGFGADEHPAFLAGKRPQGWGATREELNDAVTLAESDLADARAALAEEEAAVKDQVVMAVVCGERRFATHTGYTTSLASADRYSDVAAKEIAKRNSGPNSYSLVGRDEEWEVISEEVAEALYSDEE